VEIRHEPEIELSMSGMDIFSKKKYIGKKQAINTTSNAAMLSAGV